MKNDMEDFVSASLLKIPTNAAMANITKPGINTSQRIFFLVSSNVSCFLPSCVSNALLNCSFSLSFLNNSMGLRQPLPHPLSAKIGIPKDICDSGQSRFPTTRCASSTSSPE